MRRLLFGLSLIPLAACQGTGWATHTPVQPVPPAPFAPVVQPRPAARPATTDEAATNAWLDQQIERNRYVPPPPPVQPAPAPAPEPQIVYVEGDPYYYYGHRYEHRPAPATTFPVHTAIGAGLGAIIGHQSGNCNEGAWIGGGLGFLLDLGSHW
jgi:hypothetical protein